MQLCVLWNSLSARNKEKQICDIISFGLQTKIQMSFQKRPHLKISEPEIYSDLVYRIRKIVGKSNFAVQFRKLINRYKRIRCYPYIMRQTLCLVVHG